MNHDLLYKDYSLKALNTFGIDIRSKYLLPYSSEEILLRYLPEINEFQLQTLMIGEGSNLLFTGNFGGIILLSQIIGYEITEETENSVEVRVGAGVIWDDFVGWTVENNYGGIENLSAIPGTVGASPVQNIGAYGVEAQDSITQVEAIELATGKKRVFTNQECQFAYRYSIFKNELKGKYAVTYVTYKLTKNTEFNLSYGNIKALMEGREPSLALIREVITQVRESKLPDHKILGNAGSFFTNPYIPIQQYEELKSVHPNIPHYPVSDTEVKVPAGWLIDQCGLKGKEHKAAAVHKDQALVLINTGGATGQDIIELSQIVISEVEAKFKITLHPEVNIIE